MRNRSLALSFATVLATAALTGCAVTSHGVQPSALGKARPSSELLPMLTQPGPVELETVVSCDWAVERGGLINLDHPTAKRAGLEDGDEPVQVFFHALRHPEKGLFIVDTGVETALRDAPEKAAMRGLVASAMNMEKMTVHAPLGSGWRSSNSRWRACSSRTCIWTTSPAWRTCPPGHPSTPGRVRPPTAPS